MGAEVNSAVPTTVNAEMFLQVMLVFEGFPTLGAFELAVAGTLVQQLRLWRGEKEFSHQCHPIEEK